MRCPICDRDNAGDARRCKACGADFEDPDLAAQLQRPATTDDGEPNLQGDRYLGVRWIGLEVGGDSRKVALLGGIGFAIAAVLPLSLDYEKIRAVWSVLDDGPAFALLLPFILAVIGAGLWLAGEKLPAAVTSGVLAVGGLVVLGFAIAPQGKYNLLMTKAWWAPWIGIGIAGAGLIIRILRRRDPYARWIVLGGAVIVLIGLFLPYTDGRAVLPGEYPMFMRDADLLDKSIGGASIDGFDSDAMVRFLSMWHVLLLGLCIAAAGFSIAMSKGPWDSAGLVLRPLGWVVVFWIPLTFAIYTLNITGWKQTGRYAVDSETWDNFTGALFAGRFRVAVLAIPAAAWLAIGLAGLYVKLVVPRLPKSATA